MMAGDDIFIVIIVSTVSKYPTMARSVPGNVESLLTLCFTLISGCSSKCQSERS